MVRSSSAIGHIPMYPFCGKKGVSYVLGSKKIAPTLVQMLQSQVWYGFEGSLTVNLNAPQWQLPS
jgi:hypothetical protein